MGNFYRTAVFLYGKNFAILPVISMGWQRFVYKIEQHVRYSKQQLLNFSTTSFATYCFCK